MIGALGSDASDDAGLLRRDSDGGAGLLAADRGSVRATEPPHQDHRKERLRGPQDVKGRLRHLGAIAA